MSTKNQVQEYLQKKGIPLPEYTTFKCGGSPHEPLWTSQVKITADKIFVGDPQSSKKAAEFSAAEEAMSYIEENGLEKIYEEPKHQFYFTDKKINILVDVENKPTFMKEFSNSVVTSNVEVTGFVSDGSALQRQIRQSDILKDKRMKIVNVPSTRSDGADIGMAVYAGGYMSTENTLVFIIISGDHFAEALSDCIRNYLKLFPFTPSSRIPKNLQSCVCRSLDDAMDQMMNIKRHNKFND